MTNRSKFEDLIEYVVNGEQKKAEELFHEIVVEHAREIYQGLFENEISEFDLEEELAEETDEEVSEDDEIEESYEDLDEVGGDPADDLMDMALPSHRGQDGAEAQPAGPGSAPRRAEELPPRSSRTDRVSCQSPD